MIKSSSKTQKYLIWTGLLVAYFLLSQNLLFAQEEEYVCPPCGCKEDTHIVYEPGNCGTCGMARINLTNPSAGLKYTNIWPAQLCDLLSKNQEIILLDVRSVAEYENVESRLSRLKNSINIPITEINDRLDELEKYKDKKIVVLCSISARSTRVSQTLSTHGFDKIHNLLGGLNYWVDRPLEELSCKDSLLERNQ